jgi:beta-galactosidase
VSAPGPDDSGEGWPQDQPGPSPPPGLPRRLILRSGVVGGALASLTAAGCASSGSPAPAGSPTVRVQPAGASPPLSQTYEFNQGWRFGGRYKPGSHTRGYDDSRFAKVTLPHTVVPLSWGNWHPVDWEDVWIYRKHFRLADEPGRRVLIDFDGVMTSARVFLNNVQVSAHQGGYLPWSTELTGRLSPKGNELAVIVDARWQDVPPNGHPGGATKVDYLQPGGIYRDVRLRTVPPVYLADLYARPASVLSAGRRVEVEATLDVGAWPVGPVYLSAELRDGSKVLAAAGGRVQLQRAGRSRVRLRLGGLAGVSLWSPDHPQLYTVTATVTAAGQTHTATVRTGFRTAEFRSDGFYLNGRRLKLFGLNRHQLFPYTGMAAAARLQRRDAELLRTSLNCNMVRCSHYPQSPDFLDACDELGLLVWQETPGWRWVGDRSWRSLLLANVNDMVLRDRNRPSVIVWGTRANETLNYAALYAQARSVARSLDPVRPTSGAMSLYSTAGWSEDLFGYDDYSTRGLDARGINPAEVDARTGQAGLQPPLPGVSYLVTESVGALDGPPSYRWTEPAAVLAAQAWLHAQVHDAARGDPRYAGLLGWAGIDYASLTGGSPRIWYGLKTPGVLDTFRVPKPGAAFYRSQVSPSVRPVVIPVFCWDSGPGDPGRPGRDAMIATNCDRLEIYADGRHVVTGRPDRSTFGHLARPPVIVNLADLDPAAADLRIDGYLGDRRVAVTRMSADRSRDRLTLTVDDPVIEADGSDLTRLTFRATDVHGNQRLQPGGYVHLQVSGPAMFIGDNPFPFGFYGGVGGAFLRSRPGQAGPVTVRARHDTLGRATVRLTVAAPSRSRRFL